MFSQVCAADSSREHLDMALNTYLRGISTGTVAGYTAGSARIKSSRLFARQDEAPGEAEVFLFRNKAPNLVLLQFRKP
jgi:hypothetical protein